MFARNAGSSTLSSNAANCNQNTNNKIKNKRVSEPMNIYKEFYVLTLEKMEPINCIVANVFGGSLASIPSNAFVKEIRRTFVNESALPRSSVVHGLDEIEARKRARPA